MSNYRYNWAYFVCIVIINNDFSYLVTIHENNNDSTYWWVTVW